jgi:4-amino-4-deoxy-L-arabinose transferase-like glycosyltransferase
MDARLRWVVLLGLAMAVFLPLLGRRPIVTSHEARVAQTAREMAGAGWPWNATLVTTPRVGLVQTATGKRLRPQSDAPPMYVNPWAVPLLNGEVRLQKPPLPYWASAISYRLLGFDSATARLPAALAGVLGTLLVYDLGRLLRGRNLAWISALVWLSSVFVFEEYRKSMADPLLALVTLASVWAWIRATRAGWRPVFLLAFYVSWALALLAKGPVALALVGIPLAAYRFCYRRRPRQSIVWHLAGLSLLLAITVPWPVYVMRHVPNALELWRYESLGEMTGENAEKARPAHFYLLQLPLLVLPWLGFAVVALGRASFSRRRLFALLWLALVVVFFSLSHIKKAAYLLPAMPALVLLIGQVALGLLAAARRRKRWPLNLARFQVWLGVAMGLGLAALLLISPTHRPHGRGLAVVQEFLAMAAVNLSTAKAAAAALALGAGIVPLIVWAMAKDHAWQRWLVTQALAYTAMFWLLGNVYLPQLAQLRSPRAAAQQALALAARPGYTLSHYRLREAEAVLLYLPLHTRMDPSAKNVVVILEDRRRRLGQPSTQTFVNDVPGRRILAVTEVPVANTQPNYLWRVFQLSVD